FRGYWCFIAAAIGWLALVGASPQHKQPESAQAQKQVTKATRAQSDYAPYPDVNAKGCYQAKDHDTADLCAQWRAAIAAEKAADSAWFANWIGGASAILTFASVVLVIAALRQTERSLSQARDANQIARESAENIGRAWICFSNIQSIAYAREHTGIRDGILFTPVWINSGPTPAFRLGIVPIYAIGPRDSPVPTFIRPNIANLPGQATAGPGKEFHPTGIVFDDEQAIQFRKQIIDLFAYYFIICADCYNATHGSRFVEATFRIRWNAKITLEDGTERDEMIFEPVGEQNAWQ
ncbi:MAG: hypothetical protein K2P79_11255, partial [Sphingomonas sp.]|nr:hypothetical protein [Sphingomonas sp.]